jgi:Tol biopolymer transport system component
MHRKFLLFVLLVFILAGCQQVVPPQVVSSTATPGESAPTQVSGNPPPQENPTPSEAASTPIVYIGIDGNLWTVDPASGAQDRMTDDGTPPMENHDRNVQYSQPRWSSDGSLLAYTRLVGTTAAEGMTFEHGLWVYDPATAKHQALVQNQPVYRFDWQPGSSKIAYSLGPAQDYFAAREGVNSAFATGVYLIDARDGSQVDLVLPESGYTLVSPQFSPDGRWISFEEILYMEGRGQFAVFNLESGQYQRWGIAIGGVKWSPDAQRIVYDYLNYAPSGEERVAINVPGGGSEQIVMGKLPKGYVFNPVFSPDGSEVAYLIEQMGENGVFSYSLAIQPLQGNRPAGEPRELRLPDMPGSLSWSPDGAHLLLPVGPYGQTNLALIDALSGEVRYIAKGWDADWK